MENTLFFWLIIAFIIALVIWKGVKIVPQQQAWIVEKLGRFDRKLVQHRERNDLYR